MFCVDLEWLTLRFYVYWSFNVSEGIDKDSQPLIGNARHSAHLETALEFIKAFRDTCKLCLVAS